MSEVPVHPMQTHRSNPRDQAVIPQCVSMHAYEVYCHVYGAQEAMVTGGCRGGFHYGELLAFLYARSFPKAEWRMRTEEAMRGMKT